MTPYYAAALVLLSASVAAADPLNCNLSQYKAASGLAAAIDQEALVVTWTGAEGVELRMRLAIDAGRPVVRELAVRRRDGPWAALGGNLVPEFNVTSGKRRITNQQLNPLRSLGVEITPEIIEKEKWNAFWDAPLVVPGNPGTNPDLPRRPDEIRHASATFQTSGCEVKTDGGRLEVTFPGLTIGTFSGRLQFTVFKGTNLIRQEAIAKTDEPSVAYKYSGGLKGFSTQTQRVRWRDTGGDWQKYEFGGSANSEPVPLRARNRIATVEGQGGSVAVFPPPHKFFFSRETEINLGYVYYRKDDEKSFSVGVRHEDRDDIFRPIGTKDEWIESRIRQARNFAVGNFALYNAQPGTWQRMAVFFYLSPNPAPATQDAVLAFTSGDRYRPLAGYQTMMTHIHPPFTMELMDAGTLDRQPPWIPALRARGVNIVAMSDFHADGHMTDPGPIRLAEQQRYFEASRRHSDKEFLILPFEEPHDYVGGHWNTFFPKPVYWTHVRKEGQAFVEQNPTYGNVYHVGSIDDVLEMVKRENGFFYTAHQRTKGSTGLLDMYIRKQPYFKSDYFLGAEYRANVPTDLSEKRMLEWAGLTALDDMNNWTAEGGIQAKYLVAATDTYMKFPEDDIYPQSYVNYVKLDRLPKFDEDWSPIVRSLRAGDFFVSSGEIVIKQFAVEGGGNQRTVAAEFDWTFPLDFVEVVWGDGQKTDRQIISASDLPPFGTKRFSVPLDVTGKKWVRVAAWDVAGNGAFSQPIRLNIALPTSASR
jgi:hypothetical protein